MRELTISMRNIDTPAELRRLIPEKEEFTVNEMWIKYNNNDTYTVKDDSYDVVLDNYDKLIEYVYAYLIICDVTLCNYNILNIFKEDMLDKIEQEIDGFETIQCCGYTQDDCLKNIIAICKKYNIM